jgi:periplasmic protein TonB
MLTMGKDRLTRGMFAAVILAAHVLLIYMLAVNAGVITSPLPSGGAAMLILVPDDSRPAAVASVPPEIEPQMIPPQEPWSPSVPDIDIVVPVELSPLDSAEYAQSASLSPSDAGLREMPNVARGATGIAILQRVLPEYPRASMREGEEGGTILQVLVDEGGRASDVKVTRSSGFERLDESAVRAVRQWKFAPATKGALAVAAWGEMELRFNLYRFTVARIHDAPLDLLPPGELAAGVNETPVPGGDVALQLLMDELAAAIPGEAGTAWPSREVARIKEALAGWGGVRSIQYRGAAAGHRWRTYEVKPEYRKGRSRETVELRWDLYEVSHEHGSSEWRIAVDRNGTIWCAHAGATPQRSRFR